MQKQTIYNISTLLVLKALLRGDENITALDGGRFLTTRLTNIISKLRKKGLKIETETLTSEATGKKYGRYKLIQTDNNIKLVIKLIEKIEQSLD